MTGIVLTLDDDGRFEPWRDLARAALQRAIPPDALEWRVASADAGLFDNEGAGGFSGPVVRDVTLRKSCLDLLRGVLRHSDGGRFALAYRIAWRAQMEPSIANHTLDPDVARARRMVHQVRRDYHKMTAFVRFREQPREDGQVRRRFMAWFEPEHHVLESVAPFFAGRFADMDWVILTPRGSIAWDGERTVCRFVPCDKPRLTDDVAGLWDTYYASTFNPARIKTKAMRSEMPRKYWKNLPETDLIPALLAGAEARVAEMAAREAGPAPAFHARLQARQRAGVEAANRINADPGSLEALQAELRACTRCPLHCGATQVVPGVGPGIGPGVEPGTGANAGVARIMVVGEQPGDQEDLAGVPFIGPAGQVLDKALEEVGLRRDELYLTNAVKHFKFRTQGRRRIHQTPDRSEVAACGAWLEREIAVIRPELIVTLGATALHALEGWRVKLADVRDRIRPTEMPELPRMPEAPATPARLATIHPSYLLRIPDTGRAQEERRRFIGALEAVRIWRDGLVRGAET